MTSVTMDHNQSVANGERKIGTTDYSIRAFVATSRLPHFTLPAHQSVPMLFREARLLCVWSLKDGHHCRQCLINDHQNREKAMTKRKELVEKKNLLQFRMYIRMTCQSHQLNIFYESNASHRVKKITEVFEKYF